MNVFWANNLNLIFWIKISTQERGFKGYASTYNINILNYFNPEIQLKDTDSAINRFLYELKGL